MVSTCFLTRLGEEKGSPKENTQKSDMTTRIKGPQWLTDNRGFFFSVQPYNDYYCEGDNDVVMSAMVQAPVQSTASLRHTKFSSISLPRTWTKSCHLLTTLSPPNRSSILCSHECLGRPTLLSSRRNLRALGNLFLRPSRGCSSTTPP